MVLYFQSVLGCGAHPYAFYLPGELESVRGRAGASTRYGIGGCSVSDSLPGSGLTLAGLPRVSSRSDAGDKLFINFICPVIKKGE